jgi:tetratricopeptide (TPR) repeat protein
MSTNEQPTADAKPTLEPEFKPVIDLLNGASALAEKGQLDAALTAIGAAESTLVALPEELRQRPRGFAIAAALCEGRGQIALRKQDFAGAHGHLEQAEALRQKEVEAGGTPNPLARAVSNLNLSSASQRLGKLDDALVQNARCLQLLAEAKEPQAALFMAAALEARGTLFAGQKRFDEALEAIEHARNTAQPLVDGGVAAARPLLSEIFINAARVTHALSRTAESIDLAQKAADVAWQQLEASQFKDPQSASLYVSAEMNQVAYAEALGAFARGEDALFRVIKLIGPDPRVVEHGIGYYTRLQALTDAQLEAGDLPRDEVEESLAKLKAMVKPGATA